MNLAPQAVVDRRDVDKGLRWLLWDAAFATAVGALNSGVILVAYALWLGAPNTVIGILAAVPFWTQALQAPAVSLVERLRARRRICIIALTVARLSLLPMAFLPFIPDKRLALTLLLALEINHTALNAICACAWNSWIRDLVPEDRLGRFFARRTIWATALNLVCSLAAGAALQSQNAGGGGGDGRVFTLLYLLGFASAVASTLSLAQVPEPQMAVAAPKRTLVQMLKAPLKDRNFRNLIRFMASWQFAVNSATPFFTVYFIQQLGYGMAWVMAFSIVSQIANLIVLRLWGRLTDRLTNKSVLGVAAPAFIACIAAMIVASQITDRAWLSAYLLGLHILMGMASAGVGLATGNIAIKLAPRGSATAYIAANALIASAAAGLAPVIGGVSADFFAARAIQFQILWTSPDGVREFFHLHISHWDFYFLISATLGLYAGHRLAHVREEGAVPRRAVMQELISEATRTVRNLSPVVGLRPVFPGGWLLETHARLREQIRADRARASRALRQAAGA